MAKKLTIEEFKAKYTSTYIAKHMIFDKDDWAFCGCEGQAYIASNINDAAYIDDSASDYSEEILEAFSVCIVIDVINDEAKLFISVQYEDMTCEDAEIGHFNKDIFKFRDGE